MFEKGLFLFIGVIAITNILLFILSIYYSTNLFNTLLQKIMELQRLS